MITESLMLAPLIQEAGEIIVENLWGILVASGLIGLVTTGILGGLKTVIAKVADLPNWGKRISAVVIAEVLAAIQALTNLELPTTLDGLDEVTITGLIGALFSMGAWRLLKMAGIVKGDGKP